MNTSEIEEHFKRQFEQELGRPVVEGDQTYINALSDWIISEEGQAFLNEFTSSNVIDDEIYYEGIVQQLSNSAPNHGNMTAEFRIFDVSANNTNDTSSVQQDLDIEAEDIDENSEEEIQAPLMSNLELRTKEIQDDIIKQALVFDNDWLNKMAVEGIMSPIWVEHIPLMIDILDRTYPENWDLQPDVHIMSSNEGVYTYKIIAWHPVIRFREITISNSDNKSRTIYELFIRVKLEIDLKSNIRIESVQGKVMKVSLESFLANYDHSHLANDDFWKGHTNKYDYCSFCTGSGEINFLMGMINAGFTGELFQMVLLQLETIATWESIEGGPRYKMADIASNKNLINVDSAKESMYRKIMHDNKKLYKRPLDWTINNGKYEIVDNHKLEDFCRVELNLSYMTLKDSKGDYYNTRYSKSVDIVVPEYSMQFRNEVIKFEVLPPPIEEETIDNKTYYIHPEIKQYVRKRIEHTVNLKAIEKSILKRRESNSNTE